MFHANGQQRPLVFHADGQRRHLVCHADGRHFFSDGLSLRYVFTTTASFTHGVTVLGEIHTLKIGI